MPLTDRVTIAEIDAVLQRPWRRLKFPKVLEACFEAETGRDRSRRLIITGLIALVLFDSFLFSDANLIPDVFETAVAIRIGIVTPLALAITFVLFMNPPPIVREGSEAIITVIAAAGGIWLMFITDSPFRPYYHYGNILLILFATVVQRLRFWYAATASLLALAVYVVGVSGVDSIPPEAATEAISVYASAILFTLIASHTLERDTRRDFLFGLRDRLRHQELEETSRRDPLTALANRRFLDKRLDELWLATADRTKWVAVLMLDLDNFKLFNDRYGHLAGDTCLKRVSAIVAAELRGPDDIAARFGGEELVTVFTGMDLGDGVRIAERLRRAIEAVAIPHEQSPYGVVTVSIGVSAGQPSDGLTANELIAGADAALYAAKRNGRNQVWPPLVALTHDVVALPTRRNGTDKKLG